MIDAEWKVEETDGFTWWPWLLPQSIYVSARNEVEFDGRPETGIRITIETILGTATSRDVALEAVAELMVVYPFGSIVVLDDNRIALLASVFLHSRNRGLLNLVHQEALLQASFAPEIFERLSSEGVLSELSIHHPVSGPREIPDELMTSIYGSDTFTPLFDLDHLPDLRSAVRSFWKRGTERTGAVQGFENDDVTFMTFPDGFDSAVGWRDDEYATTRFGPSLMIWNNLLDTERPFPPHVMNSLNILLAENVDYGLGHLGGITQSLVQDGDYAFNTIRHIAQLPTYFVFTPTGSPDGMIMTITNAVYQASASARLIHGYLHSSTTETD